jgi:hypothetical protein
MEQNLNTAPPEASTDEQAFPLTQNAFVPSLVSDELTEAFTSAAAAAEAPRPGRAVRHDGWTPERIRGFLTTLAECGVVADAARAVGISAQSAYRFRNRAGGRAFHIAWVAAAGQLGRRRLSDESFSRAMNGCIDKICKDGIVVAERHRYDNRLTMAVLTRLDKQAESNNEENAVARIVAQEFDQFVDIVCTGNNDEAANFIADRRELEEKPSESREAELLRRLRNYQNYRAGLLHEIDVSDLDPDRMEEWTEEQTERADLSGFFDTLEPEDWPESIREGEGEKMHGNANFHHFHSQYRRRLAERAEAQAEHDPHRVWQDDDGSWWTDFPVPEGFVGKEEGEYGKDYYQRRLSEEEQAAIDADVAMLDAEERAGDGAARDRFFGFDPPAGGGNRQ